MKIQHYLCLLTLGGMLAGCGGDSDNRALDTGYIVARMHALFEVDGTVTVDARFFRQDEFNLLRQNGTYALSEDALYLRSGGEEIEFTVEEQNSSGVNYSAATNITGHASPIEIYFDREDSAGSDVTASLAHPLPFVALTPDENGLYSAYEDFLLSWNPAGDEPGDHEVSLELILACDLSQDGGGTRRVQTAVSRVSDDDGEEDINLTALADTLLEGLSASELDEIYGSADVCFAQIRAERDLDNVALPGFAPLSLIMVTQLLVFERLDLVIEEPMP